jgi:hypothetical protein
MVVRKYGCMACTVLVWDRGGGTNGTSHFLCAARARNRQVSHIVKRPYHGCVCRSSATPVDSPTKPSIWGGGRPSTHSGRDNQVPDLVRRSYRVLKVLRVAPARGGRTSIYSDLAFCATCL